MLVQSNSYVVPAEKRDQHDRLMQRFRQALRRHGCHHFQVMEEVESDGRRRQGPTRFVQLLRFRDRQHHQAVQAVERRDAMSQQLIHEFCELVDIATQREQGLFSVRYYLETQPELREQPEVPATERPATEGTAEEEPMGKDEEQPR